MELTEALASEDWPPPECTLLARERPLRAAEFNRLFADAVLEIERAQPDRLRLALRPSPEIAARAAGLMTAETACCSFLTFALTATGGGLVLEIAVPARHAEVLDGLARQAAAGTAG